MVVTSLIDRHYSRDIYSESSHIDYIQETNIDKWDPAGDSDGILKELRIDDELLNKDARSTMVTGRVVLGDWVDYDHDMCTFNKRTAKQTTRNCKTKYVCKYYPCQTIYRMLHYVY